MIKDFLISFKDNLKEKTRNPFLGTYLIVWIIRNWELVYTLFNFDNTSTLKDKIDFIKLYYTENDFLINLFSNVLWAFLLLVITYSLLNISRLIINISERHVTPWVYKLSDSKSVVLRVTYDSLQDEKINLELKLEKERENKAKLQNEILTLENKLDEVYLKNTQSNDQHKLNESNKIPAKVKPEKSKSSADLLFSKIESKKLSNELLDVILHLNRKDGWIEDSLGGPSVDYFAKLGLLRIIEARNGFTRYAITEEGDEVLKKVRLEIE